MRSTRMTASVIAASLALSGCRGDAVTGQVADCSDQPGCDTSAGSVSPVVQDALDDAGTRLTGSLPDATASALRTRFGQLTLALEKRDMPSGRLALAAIYELIGAAERATADARPDLSAMRLAMIPAARALGVSVAAGSPLSP